METDPVKLGTMKLMGTFGVPSYISFGDEYMKKIRACLLLAPPRRALLGPRAGRPFGLQGTVQSDSRDLAVRFAPGVRS